MNAKVKSTHRSEPSDPWLSRLRWGERPAGAQFLAIRRIPVKCNCAYAKTFDRSDLLLLRRV